MIRRLRAWWRRTQEYWQQKNRLLREADELMRQWNYAPASFEDIELYLLQIGLLHLQAASINLTAALQAKEAGISAGLEAAGSLRVH